MSTYDGNPANYPTTLTLPEQGNPPAQSTNELNALIEGLADRTAYLNARHVPAANGEQHQFPFIVLPTDPAIWGYGSVAGGSGGVGLQQLDASSSFLVFLELLQPKGATLKSLSVTVCGQQVARGVLPSTMPSIQLFAQTFTSDASPSASSEVPDGSAVVATYEAPHAITIPSLTHALDPTGAIRYYVRIKGESGGAGAIAGFTVLGLQGTIDRT